MQSRDFPIHLQTLLLILAVTWGSQFSRVQKATHDKAQKLKIFPTSALRKAVTGGTITNHKTLCNIKLIRYSVKQFPAKLSPIAF